MKKFYINSILFLLPLLLLLVLLPQNSKQKYLGLQKDCSGHGTWIHHRIFEQQKEIDIAFLGSSHTINGVNDKLIEDKLNGEQKVANLGYCRLGRNLSFVLLKELLKTKKPTYLILEVRNKEDRYSHPVFPHLASTKDVLTPTLFFNRDILNDIGTHFAYKMACNQDLIFDTYKNKVAFENFGFGTTNDTADLEYLMRFKNSRKDKRNAPSGWSNDFYMAYPRSYLNRIYDLCLENKIELVFLSLPSFGDDPSQLQEWNSYLTSGDIWIPPNEIFQNPDYWYDDNHLNLAGSEVLSDWLVEQLTKKIQGPG